MNHGTFINARTVRHERILPGPIERVWMFLTEADGLSTWLGRATVPAVTGERFSLAFVHPGETDPDGEEQLMQGETTVYEPPRLLEYLWREDGRQERVRFELLPEGDRVRLVLTHSGLRPDDAAKVGPGWHTHLDVLDARLNGGPLFPFFERYEALKPSYERRLAALPAD